MDPHSGSPNLYSSDQKASRLLMNKLKQLQKSSKDNSKLKSSSPQGNSKRKRKPQFDEHPKITTWLNTEKENKFKPLDVSVKRTHSEESKSEPKKPKGHDNKSKKSLKRNRSFDKYGVAIPSFEKIVADQKKFDEHKDNVKQLDVFDDSVLKQSLSKNCSWEPEEFTGELLDCKHLSLEELDEAFQRHLRTVRDIKDGKKFSERHNIFHNGEAPGVSVTKDLRCSASLVVYTQKQIEHLLDLLSSQFDPDNKLTSYFFKVLLPELCLLIFMDEHKMRKRAALMYLDKRPLDI